MFLADLFFPKFCLGCGYIGVYMCSLCLKRLELIKEDVCLYCKKASPFGLTHHNCTKTANIDGFMSLYHYSPILKKVIKNVKYRLATQVWEEFYKTMPPEVLTKLSFYKDLRQNFGIQPIPLSKTKYNDRGFNQASLISVFFQKFLRFPVIDLLARKKEMSAQAQMKNKKERYSNIKGSFAINGKRPDINGPLPANIILIDDVITSGSTVKEASKVLKKAGVKKVYVLALAKG